MTRVDANGYFDSEDSEEQRYTDLYDGGDNKAILFDKLQAFFENYL